MWSSKAALWAIGLLVLAVLGAYSNSFSGEFIFDDVGAIKSNPTIRELWPLWPVLSPSSGSSSTGRPLLNLSFALNYALGGLNVWGYHAVNVAIHLANALLLFGVVRRSFALPALRERFGGAAVGLSFAIALLWAVHPLQTESVTYIVQRAESLVGLFYLLVLYCVIRGAESARPAGWYAAAVLTCLLGMSAKEVMVTAPAVVLLYDRCFLAGSFREALSKRWWVYAGMALTWALLAYLMAMNKDLISLYAGNASGSLDLDPWAYGTTQPSVILHYLRLVLWPHPLVLDYQWPVPKGIAEVLPAALTVGLLAGATLWGVLKRKPWGFLGAWFFMILSPTSSIVPLRDLVFEHRMYLPLAGVIALLVLAVHAGAKELTRRGWLAPGSACLLGIGVLAVLVVALGTTTFLRNNDYASGISIWQDTLLKAPDNPRVHFGLANALSEKDALDKAIEHYREALRLKPDYAEAEYNLSVVLAARKQVDELAKAPGSPGARVNLGYELARMGRNEEAIVHYLEALKLRPGYPEALLNLGNAEAALGRSESAIGRYREVLKALPDSAEAHNNLGAMLAGRGDIENAHREFREALRINPAYADARANLDRLAALSRQKR